jgi:hypothetical protein
VDGEQVWHVDLELRGIWLVGMVVACLFGLVGTRPNARPRTPAILAFVASAPCLIGMLHLTPSLPALIRLFGVPFVLVFAGAIATSIASFAVAVMPLPAPPASPPIAPARIVESCLRAQRGADRAGLAHRAHEVAGAELAEDVNRADTLVGRHGDGL